MSNRSSRWEDVARNREAIELARSVEQKPYRGTVHVTILARNKREARKALESVRGINPDVHVESTEGPEEVALPDT